MAQITKPITVDVSRKNLFQAIVAKQNDSDSRYLKVSFVNEGEPILIEHSSSVLINAERADGAAKSFAGTANNDGTVTVPLTNWMLELDDFVRCDISIIDSESRKLTSTSFTIEVEAASNSSEDISEDDENYDLLLVLLGDVAGTKQACEAATAAANSAATSAADSSVRADVAASKATAATMAATQATENADIATQNATAAANDAREATRYAEAAMVDAVAATRAAQEAAKAVGDAIDGITIKDTTNSIDYLAKFRIIDGQPAIEYIVI